MTLKSGANLYFMGIGGTGMAAVAGLFQSAGFQIDGSDKGVYPPMSTMLEELKIDVKTPYSSQNFNKLQPDLVVVANALSRGNEEIEYVLENNIPYTSFPKLLGEQILATRQSIVVSGTHGKTTTASICSQVLSFLGEEPGFLIGGIPRNFPRSFHLGQGDLFVIEGDEYDTAFFDKGPKFLHYRPQFLILNNLEFDHADIFENLEAIEKQFIKLCHLVENKKTIIANIDDPGILNMLKKADLLTQVTQVSTRGQSSEADVVVLGMQAATDERGLQAWTVQMKSAELGELELKTQLSGEHNMANIAQVVGLLVVLKQMGKLKNTLNSEAITAAFASFQGVARRLDHLGKVKGIDIFEDFAHHPTAIASVIKGFKKAQPQRRLTVAFEPANATGRRSVLMDDFAAALKIADHVLIGKCPQDQRIPEKERMDTSKLQNLVGANAKAFAENSDLLNHAAEQLQPDEAIIFMSPSSFSGIQYQLNDLLKKRFGKIA